jgi:NDP-sugar pyrophosphorylase family protein
MRQAVILAGGKGERLRPLTEDRPKAMIDLLGSPLLGYQIQWLRSHGFSKIVICCGYRHEVIREHFGDGGRWQVQIEYLVESEPLGRGGALKQALKHIGDTKEPVLALNGDLITNLVLGDLFEFHKKQGGLATISTVPLRSPYGIVDCAEDSTITGFREKPELPFLINAGIYVLEQSIVGLLPDKGDHEEFTFPKLAQEGRLKAYQTRCFWRTMDTVKDHSEVRSELEKMFLTTFFTQPVSPSLTSV